MSAIAPAQTNGCTAVGGGEPFVGVPTGSIQGLPPPLLSGMEPTDALGMMMAAIERMSMSSMTETERRIQGDKKKLDEAIDKFMTQIGEAIEAARRAAEASQAKKKKGLFGKLASKIVPSCAKVVGASVDFARDVVETQPRLAYALVKNPGNPQAVIAALQTQMYALASNGDTAKSIEGFTQGVLQFTADYTDFLVAYQAAGIKSVLEGNPDYKAFLIDGLGPSGHLARCLIEGNPDHLKKEAIKLWDSLSENILMNEAFWEVVEPAVKATMIAGTALSGGTLAFVAVGVFILLEADSKYPFIDELSPKYGQHIRLGLMLGAMATAAGGGGDVATLAKYMQGGATLLSGAAQIEQGRLIKKEANRQADAMHQEADMKETLNRMRMLHQMIDELLDLFAEQQDSRNTNRSMFNSLAQAEAKTLSATIFRA